jgi:hypothetical protein
MEEEHAPSGRKEATISLIAGSGLMIQVFTIAMHVPQRGVSI